MADVRKPWKPRPGWLVGYGMPEKFRRRVYVALRDALARAQGMSDADLENLTIVVSFRPRENRK